MTWSIIPFLIMLIMFWWGAICICRPDPPKDAMEVFVTGKQWMWKMQYPDGSREINALHVPVGQPVKLTMASEDVIHSFSIPAFGCGMTWFPATMTACGSRATKPGRYRLLLHRILRQLARQHDRLGGRSQRPRIRQLGGRRLARLACRAGTATV